MNLKNAVALVSGGSRGLGRAIVDELLNRGVGKIYVTARNAETVKFDSDKVVPLSMNITDFDAVSVAKLAAQDVNLLINNAGINSSGSITQNSIDILRQDMNTNFYGTVNVIKEFAPILEKNGGGNVVNLLSICSFGSMPALGGYCASKAALYSATHAFRTELAASNITVQAAFPGPIDTDMNEGLEIEMATPESVANEIIDAIETDTHDIYPDPIAKKVHQDFTTDPKLIEKEFALIV